MAEGQPKELDTTFTRRTTLTPEQIQRMEEVFNRNAHPTVQQREMLAQEMGLEPTQIMYWFQNKRVSVKNKDHRDERSLLFSVNEKLLKQNKMYKEMQKKFRSSLRCKDGCLQLENVKLKNELDWVSNITHLGSSLPVSKPWMQISISGELVTINEILRKIYRSSSLNINSLIDLAQSALQEFLVMAEVGQPLWQRCTTSDGSVHRLNAEVYSKKFPRLLSVKPPSWIPEATRDSILVHLRPNQLIELLMSINNWSKTFSNIVSSVNLLEVFIPSNDYDGTLYVMSAVFHVPCPFVPTRRAYFLRYCKCSSTDTWAVVDLSLDDFLPIQTTRCRRRPSGWLIKDMSDGYSKVTFLEHVEVEKMIDEQSMVQSASCFGAKRWCATLFRQTERQACASAVEFHPSDLAGTINGVLGKRNILKTADRLISDFYSCAMASNSDIWTLLPDTGNKKIDGCIRFLSQEKTINPEGPSNLLLSVVATFKLSAIPSVVFSYLQNMANRKEWDVLSNPYDLQENVHISIGDDQRNFISLLTVKSENDDKRDWLMLQETISDAAGSLLVYSFVDAAQIAMVCNGGNHESVSLLPCGIAILPAQQSSDGDINGSLLTIALQFEYDGATNSLPTQAIENIVYEMIKSIRVAMDSHTSAK